MVKMSSTLEQVVIELEAVEDIAISQRDTENDKECPICFDALFKNDDDEAIPPVTLQCGHKFCRECFDKHHNTCIQQMHDVNCPLCRQVIYKNTSIRSTPSQQQQRTPVQPHILMGRMIFVVPMAALYASITALLVWALVTKYG